ncbi:hypothetical protein ACQP1O_43060 (plasmid) [Nocardia sp. CA-151230]|uniref:hypothetical protein n=1 Tax=Nocardia sp. CA-151230 TaxID=3239982 RepID=UPI003D8D2BCE
MSDNPLPVSKFRKFRADDELWNDFADAVRHAPDPEADMSKVLRQFIRWYIRRPGAQIPKRPEPGE